MNVFNETKQSRNIFDNVRIFWNDNLKRYLNTPKIAMCFYAVEFESI